MVRKCYHWSEYPYYILETAFKMHQNQYKQGYVWSSSSWDSLWYFRIDIFLLKHVVSVKRINISSTLRHHYLVWARPPSMIANQSPVTHIQLVTTDVSICPHCNNLMSWAGWLVWLVAYHLALWALTDCMPEFNHLFINKICLNTFERNNNGVVYNCLHFVHYVPCVENMKIREWGKGEQLSRA